MTETELHRHLGETVDKFEPAPDLLDRVRAGGTRRLRRRRLTAVGATALSVLLAGSLAVAGPRILAGDDPGVASVNAADPYGNLLKGKTQGDLSRDKQYLEEVTTIWQNSHTTSGNNLRGIFDDLRGKPKVAWAGNTPGGRAAVVVQQAYLHAGKNFPDDLGLRTLVGFIGAGTDGKQQLIADDYAPPGAGRAAGFLTGAGTAQAMVVLDQGKPVGYSTQREYLADGSSRRVFTPLTFGHGVGIVRVPAGVTAESVALTLLPATGTTDLRVLQRQTAANQPRESRLWLVLPPSNLWPMTDHVKGLDHTALGAFVKHVERKSDPYATRSSYSLWVGYGRTANGSGILLGEQVLQPDQTRVYAVLTSPTRSARIIPGGIPDKNSVLPVAIKLPDGQGWAVAQKGAQLSYRTAGTLSKPRPNALLVPAGASAEVRVVLNGKTVTVPLR